jgi:hypothetical protein
VRFALRRSVAGGEPVAERRHANRRFGINLCGGPFCWNSVAAPAALFSTRAFWPLGGGTGLAADEVRRNAASEPADISLEELTKYKSVVKPLPNTNRRSRRRHQSRSSRRTK